MQRDHKQNGDNAYNTDLYLSEGPTFRSRRLHVSFASPPHCCKFRKCQVLQAGEGERQRERQIVRQSQSSGMLLVVEMGRWREELYYWLLGCTKCASVVSPHNAKLITYLILFVIPLPIHNKLILVLALGQFNNSCVLPLTEVDMKGGKWWK